jgi:hypothetical protein
LPLGVRLTMRSMRGHKMSERMVEEEEKGKGKPTKK